MKRIALTLCALFAAMPAWAGTCTRDGAVAYMRASESGWAESVVTGDISIPKRVLAEDFVGVGTDGAVYGKRDALAETDPSNFASDHLDYIHVRFFGDTAIVQGSERWTRKTGTTGHFVWIDTWACSAGNWRIESAADVNVPDRK